MYLSLLPQGVAVGLGYKWFSTILRNFEKTLCELGGKTATSATIYDRITNLIFT
jgi:hypothetical protein